MSTTPLGTPAATAAGGAGTEFLFETHDGIHRLVYIEYWDGQPHAAISEPINHAGAASNWDIEADERVEGEYMFYESGGFGLAHHGIDVTADEYWASDLVRISSVAAHSKRLEAPLNTALFEQGREVFDIVYCRVCDKFYDEDWCWLHHREKKDGSLGYRKGFRKKDAPAAPVARGSRKEADRG